jgi:hypothetical protein
MKEKTEKSVEREFARENLIILAEGKNMEEIVGLRSTVSDKDFFFTSWEYSLLEEIKGVKIKLPKKNGKFLELIKKPVIMERENNFAIVKEYPSYWRYGIFVDKVLVTRTFRFPEEGRTRREFPFGKEVVCDVEIKIAENLKTGEKKIIVDYIINEEAEEILEIKIGGVRRDETIKSFRIPGTSKDILVNKLV